MLKLLWCEFAKLRRKPLFFAAAAVSALIPLGCAMFLPDFQEFTSGAEAVDGMMSTLFQMSAYLLLIRPWWCWPPTCSLRSRTMTR